MHRPPPAPPRRVPTRVVREPGIGTGGAALALAVVALILVLLGG